MRPTTPPRIATSLLERFASGPQRNALIGDLLEEYHRRRSRVWYWSQVLTAILVGALADVREHAAVAARAIVVWYVLSLVAAWIATALHQSLGLIVWNWTVSHDLDAVRVAWFGRPRYGSPLMLAAACINAMCIGWTVVRVHRRHAAAVLLSCVFFSSLYALFVRYTWMMLWPITFFVNAPFVAPMPFWIGVVGVPVCLLLGGVFASRPPSEPEHPHIGTES